MDETYGKAFAFIGFLAITVLVAPILIAFLGGVGAVVVGWAFEGTIRAFLKALGLDLSNFSMFQIGVGFGFLSSYVKAVLSKD